MLAVGYPPDTSPGTDICLQLPLCIIRDVI